MKQISRVILMLIFSSISINSAFAESKNGDMAQFARGAQKWSNTCMRCHNMREPQEFSDQEWRPVMMHMRIRAGLTGQDAEDILAFMQKSNN